MLFFITFEITWNQFLELLDVESDLREELLDWHMFEVKTKMFVEYQRKYHFNLMILLEY